MAVLGAPFGPHARRTLLRLVRLGLRRGGPVDAQELEAIDQMLSQSADMPASDVDPSKKTTPADLLRLPFLIAYTAFWMARLAFIGFIVGPLLALTWRSRRYLADATAVQLARNPDGVASGLAALASRGGVIPGGSWATPLFVIGPERGSAGGFRGDDFGIVELQSTGCEPARPSQASQGRRWNCRRSGGRTGPRRRASRWPGSCWARR